MSDPDEVATHSATIAAAVAGFGDLDAALVAFDALPAGLPARAKLAAALIDAIFRTGQVPEKARARALSALVAAADVDPPDADGWRRTRTAAEVFLLAHQAAEMRLSDPAAALRRLDELATAYAGDAGITAMVESGRMALSFALAAQGGDAGAMSRMPGDVAGFLSRLPPGVAGRPEAELLTRMAGLMAAGREGADVTAGFQELADLAGTMSPDSPVRAAFAEASTDLVGFATLADDDADRPTDAQIRAFIAQAGRPGATSSDRALLHAQAAMTALWAGRETDVDRVGLGVDQARAALDLTDPGDEQRPFYLTTLAGALLQRFELTGTTADLRGAGDALDEARSRARGPEHPLWQEINEMLAHVRRQIGDRPGSHQVAVEGLRGTVWQVLIQPDRASATAAVRDAGASAVDVARLCLAAGDPAAAVTALDAGRGLALFAATFSATGAGPLADRLVEVGEEELAERWRAAAATGDAAGLPAALRREVLTVLARHDQAAGLLDPPGYAEIQHALTELNADALVYLVGGEGVRPGQAVIAPAAGPPAFLTLPELTVDAIPDLHREFAVLDGRDLAPADQSEIADLAAAFDRIGGWAWGAALRPLVEVYLPRQPAPSGRPHRIVLLPMGELARVPWQAARRPDGRYAIESVALSQVASARMLVRSGELASVPLTPTGLVVGDPANRHTRPLPSARLEAYAIRQAFYRGATYLGRRPDGSDSRSGPGTARAVRDWLISADPLAGSVLHLACHGIVQAGGPRATAYLQLAPSTSTGEPDDRLPAEELVELLAGAPDRAIALVVLAACRTGLSLSGYDEAYSLGTALLAGGVRTVLSSQWSVPDVATSALMFMVHHYLRVDGRPPWAALRDAQLWMLDPDRVLPDDMPAPLRDQIDHSNLAAVVGWAAFVHWGQ